MRCRLTSLSKALEAWAVVHGRFSPQHPRPCREWEFGVGEDRLEGVYQQDGAKRYLFASLDHGAKD